MIELLNFTGSYLGAKEKFNPEYYILLLIFSFFRGGRSNTHQKYKQIVIMFTQSHTTPLSNQQRQNTMLP